MKSNFETDNERFLREGKKMGAAYVLNVCDTWDYSHYPVFVMPDEDVNEITDNYNSQSMQRVYSTIKVK